MHIDTGVTRQLQRVVATNALAQRNGVALMLTARRFGRSRRVSSFVERTSKQPFNRTLRLSFQRLRALVKSCVKKLVPIAIKEVECFRCCYNLASRLHVL